MAEDKLGDFSAIVDYKAAGLQTEVVRLEPVPLRSRPFQYTDWTQSCNSFQIGRALCERRKAYTNKTTHNTSTLPPVGDWLSTPGCEPGEPLSGFATRAPHV